MSGYAWGQLQRALASAGSSAAKRVRQWLDVLSGIGDDSLAVGSRTPVAGFPAWVTLEVAHGGFATGTAVAAANASEAEANTTLLTDQGLEGLRGLRVSGHYRIDAPENAALLAVSWLLDHGQNERAAEVLTAIQPFFSTLRFHPHPAVHAQPDDADRVAPSTVGEVAAAFAAKKPNPSVAAMYETLVIWKPLYARAVALFLGPQDAWLSASRVVLADFDRARAIHELSGKPEKPKENFARLRVFMKRLTAGETLGAADLAAIRHITAAYVRKHGEPRDAAVAALPPLHVSYYHALAEKLAALPPESLLDDAHAIADPKTPGHIVRKLARCVGSTLEELVASGLITSPDALAVLLPPFVAPARTSAVEDRSLARLYNETYRAFHERRSLLLMNLESQVRLDELPWVSALAPWLPKDEVAMTRLLQRTLTLSVGAFPYKILPNPLVEQLRELVAAPWTVELAADIFNGKLAPKFEEAARRAAQLMRHTIYERYYGLDYADTAPLIEQARRRTTPAGNQVVTSARVIEQAQIITTHNLVLAFGYAPELDRRRAALARDTLAWIAKRPAPKDFRARLHLKKSCAYAWRQLVFFIATLHPREAASIVEGAKFRDPAIQEHAADLLAAMRGKPRVTARPFYGWE